MCGVIESFNGVLNKMYQDIFLLKGTQGSLYTKMDSAEFRILN